ncbi:hypothetical protein WN55_01530 [Dufourea novaeangliae]|uniref:Uncharacterized protein n=1 Tax=Dufourea novaeangliae TaxID=178035 RepID=A0A154PG57_DUFNO|nr:hypothetical protein WN55_01530 [Dufourea novaeangliae]
MCSARILKLIREALYQIGRPFGTRRYTTATKCDASPNDNVSLPFVREPPLRAFDPRKPRWECLFYEINVNSLRSAIAAEGLVWFWDDYFSLKGLYLGMIALVQKVWGLGFGRLILLLFPKVTFFGSF